MTYVKDIEDCNMLNGITPISPSEREMRCERMRRLMRDYDISAVILEPGSSLYYYTGVEWNLSERLFVAVIPFVGQPTFVCPAFEGERLSLLLHNDYEVRVWEEDESPYELMAAVLRDHGIGSARIGAEQNVRFSVYDGMRSLLPRLSVVSADPVIIPCRSRKSAAEIALMQRAADITVEAFKVCIGELGVGIFQSEAKEISRRTYRAMGVEGGIAFQFGDSTSFPHGSGKDRSLEEGDVVLMDGGCRVEGYHSDITRTFAFGEPRKGLQAAWELEKVAQRQAFEAAQVGASFESIDTAARTVLENAGYGPGYRVPGLPHRTGHGIGLDVHEWHYVVQGNKTLVRPGMCFSIEPMLVVPGQFGVRLEDCVYVAETGARFFSNPSPSLAHPFP